MKSAKRKFACKLMGSDIRRLCLLEDLNDKLSYEGGQTKDANWILEEVWLSVCNGGEEAG